MMDTDRQIQAEELRNLTGQMSETNRLVGVLVQRVDRLEHKIDGLTDSVQQLQVRLTVLETNVEMEKKHTTPLAHFYAALSDQTGKVVVFGFVLFVVAIVFGAS